MMRSYCAALVCVLLAGAAGAQTGPRRAWQQRLDVDIPTAVPVVALEVTNPFATRVDVGPTLLSSIPPRKLEVAGKALLAAYVEPKGSCAGVVPIELPFPGLTSELTTELMSTRFNAARVGKEAVPSWTVLEIILTGKVKESAVVEQLIEMPDPKRLPEKASPELLYSAGRLAGLPATDRSELTSVAVPKRLRVRASGRETEVAVRALVHLTEDGRCNQYVPLEVPSGLLPWMSAFLASWRAEPALRGEEPVECWLVYTARVRVKFSTISSSSIRVLPSRVFNPSAEAPSAGTPDGA